jgi:membrane protease YdiL (CAAX protease family)
MWIAVLVSGLIFGWAHIDDRLGQADSLLTLVTIMAFSGGLGIVVGWLYWRYGLETATLTHFLTDALYYVIVLPALFYGSTRLVLGVLAGMLLVLALACAAFVRSRTAVAAAATASAWPSG